MANKPKSPPATPGGQEPPARGYEKTIARWTIVLGLSTIALVLATGISAYFLFETDQTIKKQVEAAGIQLRAYINFQQIVYIPHFQTEPNKPDSPPPGANVGLTWKNFGSTPAREVEYWTSIKWYANGTEPDFSKPESILSDRANITLGPGAEFATAAVFVPLADIQKTTVSNGRIYFWGHVSYRDYIPNSPLRQFHFCLYAVNLPASGLANFNVYKPSCNYAD